MRIFAALVPDSSFLDALEQSIAHLKTVHQKFRWMPRGNMHITLAFLGDIDNFGVELLMQTAEQTAAKIKPISAAAGKLLTLPQGKPASVLALGIAHGKERFTSLSAFFEQNLCRAAQEERYTFRREKRTFTPHITIARKGELPIPLFPQDRNIGIHVEGIFESITVFKSELFKGGALYTPLSTHEFSAA
jgi:2'-5' RNA ligase